MLSRTNADDYVRRVIEENVNNKQWGSKLTLKANQNFNVPIGIVKDVFSKNNDVENVSDFILYAIICTIDSSKLKDFYTELEIKTYSKEKYDDVIKLPTQFKVVKIAKDQWVGKISIADWMALRDLQKINYNENTQRPLKKVVRGEMVHYKIDVNKNQVDNIYQAIMNDTYIPDTITLNLPEDSLWEYDEDTALFNIEYYSHFDITDGMHRYLAFSKAYDYGKDFSDYYEELRITIFDEKKAENFIWQQDQKHKLTRIASRTFNQNSIGSYVTDKLNEDSAFKNKIIKTKGIIDSITFSNAISVLYEVNSKPGRKSQEDRLEQKRLQIDVYKKFEKALDKIIEEDLGLLDRQWDEKFLYGFVAAVYNNVTKNFLDYIQKLQSDEAISDKLRKDSLIKAYAKEGMKYV